MLRNTGAALAPLNAFLILQGIETLALRMDRICDNTLAIAAIYKAISSKVEWVRYAACPTTRTTRWCSASQAARPRAF